MFCRGEILKQTAQTERDKNGHKRLMLTQKLNVCLARRRKRNDEGWRASRVISELETLTNYEAIWFPRWWCLATITSQLWSLRTFIDCKGTMAENSQIEIWIQEGRKMMSGWPCSAFKYTIKLMAFGMQNCAEPTFSYSFLPWHRRSIRHQSNAFN